MQRKKKKEERNILFPGVVNEDADNREEKGGKPKD